MPKKPHLIFICCILFASVANAQWSYPPEILDAEKYTFKNVDNINLDLWVFSPEDKATDQKLPAIVFFFGGGWSKGSPSQFVAHCEYLKARGMVAIVADYRVKNRHEVSVKDCVSDAKSAIRWIRENASILGIDEDKIVAAGASAGGHLAASCAILDKFDEPSEDNSISSAANALVLFNPVLVLPPIDNFKQVIEKDMQKQEDKFGTALIHISPFHNITKNLPPTLIFHGTNDKVVSLASIEMFTEKMHEFENDCTLFAYKDESHGFFNYGKKSNSAFIDTVYKMDQFLVSIGYLNAPPSSELFKK